jgi:hypothetical protein
MSNLLSRNHLVSLVSAPIIWSLHFVVCYTSVSLICLYGWYGRTFLGMSLAQWSVGVATALALALIGFTALINYRKWQHSSRDDPQGRMSAFFAATSTSLCALSVVAVVFVAFPTWLLPSCAS